MHTSLQVLHVAAGNLFGGVVRVHDIPLWDAGPERKVRRYPADRFICTSRFTAEAVSRWMPSVPRDLIYPPVVSNPPLNAEERRRVRAAAGAGDRTTVIVL